MTTFDISTATREELIERNSKAMQLGLVTLTPVGGGDPFRISTGALERLSVEPLRYGARSRGQIYDAMTMRLLAPGSSKDELPSTSIEFDNTDPAYIQALQSTPFRAKLTMEIVHSTRPDEVIQTWPDMDVFEGSFDDDNVTLQVGYAQQNGEPAVKYRMTQPVAPALRGPN